MRKPILIVINGRGGCGKDSLIQFAQKTMVNYKIRNESAIDPIKQIMRDTLGWNGEKTDKDRAFMHNLKKLYSEYCNLPNKYLMSKFFLAWEDGDHIMFAHIREPEEIEDFKQIMQKKGTTPITLLVRRDNGNDHHYGNHADDDVEKYNYDYVFQNNDDLNTTGQAFTQLLESIIEKERPTWNNKNK